MTLDDVLVLEKLLQLGLLSADELKPLVRSKLGVPEPTPAAPVEPAAPAEQPAA